MGSRAQTGSVTSGAKTTPPRGLELLIAVVAADGGFQAARRPVVQERYGGVPGAGCHFGTGHQLPYSQAEMTQQGSVGGPRRTRSGSRHAAGGAGGVGERAVDAWQDGPGPGKDQFAEVGGDRTRLAAVEDGTLIRTRRRTGVDNRENFSGKHKAHGLLFLALTDETGNLIWISAARPGRSSEITTARHNKLTGHLREAGLGALADLGFVGLDDDPDDNPVVTTGRKATRTHQLTDAEREMNGLISRERAANEHGFANLKSWRVLTKVRMNARHATTLLRALLVLAITEVQR
ncbi:transposase family protein [Streptomyces sp. V1I1]|uniref:transposase family protein n=1 Tax=Streptomyces sp. V1I1 TaxID=3042272 RepID=UPI00278B5A58|nr:transposase family protein [Streptomyces sp. V1I1]MDQ0940143.1 hypothetical protein [Streptomyces sp. V1I1]